MSTKIYPRAFSHVGITVPNLEKAVDFYHSVFGLYKISNVFTILEDKNDPIGLMCIRVFGEGWKSFRMAHLSTADKIGIELFEFPSTKEGINQRPEFNPFRTGVSHFAFQDPDIEETVKRIEAHGGKAKMDVTKYADDKPFKMIWCEDPFGNIIELYTHSYELTDADHANIGFIK